MNTLPEVRIKRHETRAGALVYRARSTDGLAVSVRTTDGQVDYIRVGSGTWGGHVTHAEAIALAEALANAVADAEDESTPPATQHFRRRGDGASASVRIDGPVRRYPEFSAGGIDYVRVGSGSWGGSISHEPALALHATLQAALTGGES